MSTYNVSVTELSLVSARFSTYCSISLLLPESWHLQWQPVGKNTQTCYICFNLSACTIFCLNGSIISKSKLDIENEKDIVTIKTNWTKPKEMCLSEGKSKRILRAFELTSRYSLQDKYSVNLYG